MKTLLFYQIDTLLQKVTEVVNDICAEIFNQILTKRFRAKQQAQKCDYINSEIKQQLILVTSSNKLRRYCFSNPEIALGNLLAYAKSLEDAESRAEEIKKMLKHVEDVN